MASFNSWFRFGPNRSLEIEQICKTSGVAGACVLVVDHGETVFQHNFGFRDVAKKEPVDADTIFHIASLTKGFTGACIDTLRAQGKLSLSDPIQKHLPDAVNRDAFASKAVIADLLGHRTGLQKADAMWLGAEGELMFDRAQTTAIYNSLRPQVSLRSGFHYGNIPYGLLGELISTVAGQPYHKYLKETILDPLGMTRTIVTKENGLPENSSLAYSTLDNREAHNVPLPGSSGSVALGAAGGLLSTGNDMAKYSKALMKAWRASSEPEKACGTVFADVSWIFAPLQIMETPALREKSYASGWARSQLPMALGDIGVNPAFVGKMPVVGEGMKSRLTLWHQGSLIGATSFIMLLPETESAVIVLTNTMALNDAADWIGQLLVQSLLDPPIRHDYVQLASESADRAIKMYAELTQKVDEGRKPGGPIRPSSQYVGTYLGFRGNFRVVVVEGEDGLEVRFQGRESQGFRLQHHHDDTFTWFITFNEQIRRALFISYNPNLYMIWFKHEGEKGVTSLNWAFDSGIPEGEDFLRE
ncbi:beta-lactamase/transpeptidase-like protein [Cercophora newfieldiana]|uniref:Beta-lactamase/transpeptidase-like protein n=1 Tax=Cercophora newfieldiana TaxID=92897 RepID=A0AA39XRQ3_9PEZI|nr:beta-lactamase/transpeptidase-like protein [Cercophora newfieldiana]